MKETPIIMSGNHPLKVIDGIKTQTRRVIKPQPDLGLDEFERYSNIEVGKYYPTVIDKNGDEQPGEEIFGAYTDDGEWGWKCPYGQVGDRLWVRETTWRGQLGVKPIYDADLTDSQRADLWDDGWRKHPSIFLPRRASRITLEITEVRVERVQDISETDCEREGTPMVAPRPSGVDRNDFHVLWDSLNAKRGYGWEVNPWVWVISFKVV
ncbi:hypothetical protein LCGC14_1546180 [marine sediment metagenome]|uniref:Uncharacterized protein n=1 Tax=marine sediment metagenome TaxID=412755 RepID=A0A0F9L7R8_9ZZZZ